MPNCMMYKPSYFYGILFGSAHNFCAQKEALI